VSLPLTSRTLRHCQRCDKRSHSGPCRGIFCLVCHSKEHTDIHCPLVTGRPAPPRPRQQFSSGRGNSRSRGNRGRGRGRGNTRDHGRERARKHASTEEGRRRRNTRAPPPTQNAAATPAPPSDAPWVMVNQSRWNNASWAREDTGPWKQSSEYTGASTWGGAGGAQPATRNGYVLEPTMANMFGRRAHTGPKIYTSEAQPNTAPSTRASTPKKRGRSSSSSEGEHDVIEEEK
jgi:hypothetical protein